MTWFSGKITGVFFFFLFIYISYFLNNKQIIFFVVKIQQAWRRGKRRDGEFKSWNRELRFIHEHSAAIEMQTQRTNLWNGGRRGWDELKELCWNIHVTVWYNELNLVLCDCLEGWAGVRGGREFQEGKFMCTPVAHWLCCMAETQHNIAKQFSNLKKFIWKGKRKKKKIYTWALD